MTIDPAERHQLDERGFLVLDDFFSGSLLERLRLAIDHLFVLEGEDAGSEFKKEPGCRRLANLVDKGAVFHEVIAMPRILALVRHVLGPHVKLSSLNARSVNPLGSISQPLHADMAAIADERGYWVCNTVWMLDDYTPDNGALRIVPGSHRLGRLPQHALGDPCADHPDQVLITGRAGTVVVVNAHAWHAGLANRTTRPRTAVHAFYCRGDKPQQQYQKRLLRQEVQESLSAELRELLTLDDPLEGERSGGEIVRSGFLA